MVSKRGQGRSDRLLLVSPPRTQSSLLSSLSSDHGLPARIHRKLCHKKNGNSWDRRLVVVVVVVLTVKLMTCLWRYVITDAPNYGSRVPVDTTPGPAPVCRAQKNTPHQLINALMSCSSRRKPRQCNRGSTTVFSTTAHVDLSRPAQQGRRSPYQATGKSSWSNNSLDRETQPLRNDRMNCTTCEELQLRKIRSILHGDT